MSTPTASPWLATLGTFQELADQFGMPMLMFMGTMVDYVVVSDFFQGKISGSMMMYLGDAMYLAANFMAAAWIIYKTTLAAISFQDGFAYLYRNGSVNGNDIGLWELLFTLKYLGTAFVITIVAYVAASDIWTTMEARDLAVAQNGFFGKAVSTMDLLKFMVMGGISIMSTFIAAHAMGETVDNLIGWFDEWSDPVNNKRDQEATVDGTTDIAGTSLKNDLLYHAITAVYTWAVFFGIYLGGQIFANEFSGFSLVQNCDLSDVNVMDYAEVPTLIASQVDLESCKASMMNIFKIADSNGDRQITRCENAAFLVGIGNTADYAL